MYFVFYRTTDVFAAEEALQAQGIGTEIVPTPVQDKAYCGVCVQINDSNAENSKKCLAEMNYVVLP